MSARAVRRPNEVNHHRRRGTLLKGPLPADTPAMQGESRAQIQKEAADDQLHGELKEQVDEAQAEVQAGAEAETGAAVRVIVVKGSLLLQLNDGRLVGCNTHQRSSARLS